MKMKTKFLLFLLSLGAGLLWSCNKKTPLRAVYDYTTGMSFIKVVHAAPSFRQVTGAYRDSFNVYVGDGKVNATFLTYNSQFPSANAYFAVPAGQQTIRLALQGVLTPDSATLATFTKTLEPNAYYSFIVTDSVLKNNEAKQIFTKDVFAPTDTAHVTVRFVNAVLDDAANVDVYSKLYATNILTNVAPGTSTPFGQFSYTTATDSLIVRRAGTTTELARLGPALARTRAYTVVYKGQASVTTGTRARSLIQYTNL